MKYTRLWIKSDEKSVINLLNDYMPHKKGKTNEWRQRDISIKNLTHHTENENRITILEVWHPNRYSICKEITYDGLEHFLMSLASNQ
jgi:hypothetical protein